MGAIYNKITGKVEIVSDAQKEFFKQGAEQIKALYRKAARASVGAKIVYNLSKAYIPNLEDVSRRFIKRTDNILVDEVAGRNATPLYPVSSFDGVDGEVTIPTITMGVGDSLSLYINLYREDELKYFIGSADGDYGIRYSRNGEFLLLFPNSIYASLLYNAPNEIVKLTVIRNTETEFELFINDTTIGTIVNNDYSGSFVVEKIGSRATSFFNTVMHSFDFNNELFIPLPHLGYGFDANGNKVDLTVIGGVTEDYDENGSTHLIDKGVVDRSENRFVNNQMVDSNGDGLADGLSSLGGKGDFSIVTGNGFSGNAQRIDYDGATGGLQSLSIFDILETGEEFNISFYYRTNIDDLAITDAVNALDPDNPSPQLKVNTADAILYSTIVTYKGTNNDIYFSSWLQNEGDWFEIGDIHISKVEILPNNNEGQPISPLQEGDIYIAGSSFINKTDFMLRLFESGQTDAEYAFFNKSNSLIWKDNVISSIYYDSENTGEWHSSELTQEFIEDNLQPNALNKFWSKDYKDLFLYINALTAEQQIPANKYVS